MRTSTVVFVVGLLGLMAGCPGFGDEEGPITDVPDAPQWRRDVLPLMDRYCNECHSVPATQAAPAFFRLDECEDTGISGAQTMAERNAIRTADIRTMPPGNYSFQPTETERQIIRRWFEVGAPCDGTDPVNNTNNTNQNNTNNTNNTNQNNTSDVPFSAVVGILANGCGLANCHGAGLGYGNFSITEDATAAEVRLALEGKRASSGTAFVVANNPEASRLYQVMSSQTVGVRMPPTGNLPEAQVEAVKNWILGGARYQ